MTSPNTDQAQAPAKGFTKENIITLPHDHLRDRSKKVGSVTDEIKQIVANMEAATLDWEDSREHEVGVALAAIQIDQPYRIIIIRNDFEKREDRTFTVFINPVITKYEGVIEEDFEGCLSVRDLYGKVPRYSKVRVKAIGLDGREFKATAEGFLARVFQHEIDHTNGKMFIDHIKNKSQAFYRLTGDGKLEPLNYARDIKGNPDLWN